MKRSTAAAVKAARRTVAGAELDALIAERILGWRPSPGAYYWLGNDGRRQAKAAIWRPSRRSDEMLQVVERLRALGWFTDLGNYVLLRSRGAQRGDRFQALLFQPEGYDNVEACAPTPMLAVARAIAVALALHPESFPDDRREGPYPHRGSNDA